MLKIQSYNNPKYKNCYLVANYQAEDNESFNLFAKIIGSYPSTKFLVEQNSWIVDKDCYSELIKEFGDISLGTKENIGNGLKLKLFPYQSSVVEEALNKFCGIIKLPCGAGKTPIGIDIFIDALNRKIITGKALIVVKSTLKIQWCKEINKFCDLRANIIPTYKDFSLSIQGKIDRRTKKLDKLLETALTDKTAYEKIEDIQSEIDILKKELHDSFESLFENTDYYIVNYETLRDSVIRKRLHKCNLNYIYVDEVQAIKNDEAARSKAVCEFSYLKMKFGATATPIQKNPLDIFGLFKLINPALFPSKTRFCSVYMKYDSFGRPCGSQNEGMLAKKIAPYLIIRSEEEVNNQLPTLYPIVRYCQMEDKQIKMTEQLLEEIAELKEKERQVYAKHGNAAEAQKDESIATLEAGIMARQTFAQELAISEDLLSMSDSNLSKKYITGSKSNKIEMLIDLMEEILSSGEKVAIFSKYVRLQKILTDRINEEAKTNPIFKGIKIAYVNGGVSDEDRYKAVYEQFQTIDEYKCLLMSDAGCEGVNLSKIKYLIEMEPAESYLVQTQRHGRLKRADSTHQTVFVYQLICEKSYDEIAQKIVAKKEGYDAKIIRKE